MTCVGPATKQRIRATLRSAITSYMKQHPGVLDINPAALVDLPPDRPPRPLVWTAERTRACQHDFQARLAATRARPGHKRADPVAVYVATPRPSPVMVWTPVQTAVFLRRAAPQDHRISENAQVRGITVGRAARDLNPEPAD